MVGQVTIIKGKCQVDMHYQIIITKAYLANASSVLERICSRSPYRTRDDGTRLERMRQFFFVLIV